MHAKGFDPLGTQRKRMDLGRNAKGHVYKNIVRPGEIDKMEGREEMSARRTP